MEDRETASTNYAGSESCRDCHKAEYDLWAKSHHRFAERPIQPDLDRIAFNPARQFKHASQTSESRVEEGDCQIVTLGFRTNVEPYKVDRVIGHDPVRQFLTAADGGRWQTHEVSYDPARNEWFDVYGNDDRKPGEWGHWTGRGMNWNSRCAECHNTNLRKNYDAGTDSYQTKMAEMGVGCEACHGPMKDHVAWRYAHLDTKQPDPTVKALSPARALGMCGSCHSRTDDLTGEFKPGDSFFDHYSLEILDENEQWYPDGQVHDEDYEFTSFLSSKMYQRGVTCRDCHNVHSAKNLAQGNDLCMRCHNGGFTNAPVIDPAAHGHHKLTDKGGECIGCHMPITTYMQRHPRHDHGFTIPDPLLTKQLNIPNACNRCHSDKTTDWALEYTQQWYGEKMNRHTQERAQWIATAETGDAAGRDQLVRLLKTSQDGPYWRAVESGFLSRWAQEPEIATTLILNLKDEHPLVREKTVRALEPAVNSGSPEAIAALKPLLNDPVRNVRVAAAWALRSTVDMQSEAGQDLQASLNYNADQPLGQYYLAELESTRHQPEKALIHLRKAVEWDSYSPMFRCKLAEALSQAGQTTEALAVLTDGEKLVPNAPRLPYERAVILFDIKHYEEARVAAQRSLAIDREYMPATTLLKAIQK